MQQAAIQNSDSTDSPITHTNAPPGQRQKTSTRTSSDSTIDDSSCSFQERVISAVSKLTKLAGSIQARVKSAVTKLTNLVEHHPQFHSKLEGMLQDVYIKLELEVSASIRKKENTNSCPIFKLSNDELMHVLGYVGKNQYGFVAGVSNRFQQVYSESFAGQTSTSIECAAESVSRALLYLGTERSNDNTRANALFQAAANDGHLDVLKWGQSYGYKLETMLDKYTFAKAALFGHLEVVKYLRQLNIEWDENTCSNAAMNGHLELLKWAILRLHLRHHRHHLHLLERSVYY